MSKENEDYKIKKRLKGDENMFLFNEEIIKRAEELDLDIFVINCKKGEKMGSFFCTEINGESVFNGIHNILMQHPDKELKTAIIAAVMDFLKIPPPIAGHVLKPDQEIN